METTNSLPLLLLEIRETLRRLDDRIDDLAHARQASLQGFNPPSVPNNSEAGSISSSDVIVLLSLPDHLRKTIIALHRKGEATATEIAEETGRARAVESGYLNQLHTMRYVKKRRRGRTVYFSPTTIG